MKPGAIHRSSTRLASGNLQYGMLQAHWGYGALHDGERYEVHLCESCFFATIAYLKQERLTVNLFEKNQQQPEDDFGLAAKDNFFRDGC